MKIIGYVQPGATVCNNWGIVWSMTPCNHTGHENSIFTYPHSHHFRNASMTLVNDNTELRKIGAKNNQSERNFAVSQNSSKKVQENTENKQYPQDIKPISSDLG